MLDLKKQNFIKNNNTNYILFVIIENDFENKKVTGVDLSAACDTMN